jgi:hypothetical protein
MFPASDADFSKPFKMMTNFARRVRSIAAMGRELV